MGVAISSLIKGEEIEIKDLAHKIIAIDASNTIYQFLTTIRTRDGTPLQNSKGEITSHLVGLFNRVTTLLEEQIKLVFVFDGKSPELKQEEIMKRLQAKQQAKQLYEQASVQQDTSNMNKYAKRTSRLTKEMIQQAKQLLELMGVPHVQAASEAEAQASYLVQKELAYAVGSQDYDCLLFGAPRIIRNLSVSGRRKTPGKYSYQEAKPVLVKLSDELARLEITRQQLIMLGMLVGTDFNPGGIKGIGPKKGLQLVKQHPNPEELFKKVEWEKHNTTHWKEIMKLFLEMPVVETKKIVFGQLQADKLKEYLINQCEFNPERVDKTINKIIKSNQQKGLGEFF